MSLGVTRQARLTHKGARVLGEWAHALRTSGIKWAKRPIGDLADWLVDTGYSDMSREDTAALLMVGVAHAVESLRDC
jgi:hypothetical protein